MTSLVSFMNVEETWFKEMNEEIQESKCPIILVGLKQDLYNPEDSEHVQENDAEALAERLGMVGSLRCSAKTHTETDDGGVEAFYDMIIEKCIPASTNSKCAIS